MKKLRPLQTPNGEPVAPLLFRGLPNSCWKLKTTLERSGKEGMPFKDYYRRISVMKPEIETFTGSQWLIPQYHEIEELLNKGDSFSLALTSGPRPAYEYMAYLRHHGFSSPLLDWTRSPYVAAYFAFSKPTLAGSVSIYVLFEGSFKLRSSEKPNIYRYGPHIKTHRRHYLQQSEYTTCLVHDDKNEWRVANHEEASVYFNPDREETWDFTVKKFNIPSSERLKVLRLLDEYNLNAFSLFQTEEALLDTIAVRELELREESL
ncbi:MAG: FRG domain-containing protein [Nitrospinae bacterium]|nr:FRG domain-containing protein [Nitrospinota bacterium]